MSYSRRWERPGSFYHMNDVSVYLVVWREKRSLTERMNLKPFLVASVQVLEFRMFMKWKAFHSIFGTWNMCTDTMIWRILSLEEQNNQSTLHEQGRARCMAGSRAHLTMNKFHSEQTQQKIKDCFLYSVNWFHLSLGWGPLPWLHPLTTHYNWTHAPLAPCCLARS